MRLRHIRLRHTGTPAVVFALVMAAALTACSGGDKQAGVKKLTAAEQLASAKAKADAATSMHLILRSSGIPATANGVQWRGQAGRSQEADRGRAAGVGQGQG